MEMKGEGAKIDKGHKNNRKEKGKKRVQERKRKEVWYTTYRTTYSRWRRKGKTEERQ